MNVIHLPTSVGGNSYALAKAERKLGLNSVSLDMSRNYLNYPADIKVNPTNHLSTMYMFYKLRKEYDIFHYNYGSTILDYPTYGCDLMDLNFLHSKKIFVTYNGCDARQKMKRIEQAEICCCKYNECYGGKCSKKTDQKKEKRIKEFEKKGAHFFALNPDIMRVLPQETVFLPYTITGWDDISHKNFIQSEKNEPIVIVHAPTNRTVKGTDALVDAVYKINQKISNSIDLRLVENISHEKALEIYRTADLIVDQLRIGWYGAFAVEAMKMGKPVIVYINEDDLKLIPKAMASDCSEAIINANEFTIQDVLLRLLDNPLEIRKAREAQLEYVHKWHNPINVARITKAAYEA